MEQDRAKGGRRLGWVSDYTKGLVALAGRIGLDTTDSHETALQKRLVVVLCAGTLPLTVLWSAIYLAAGVPLAAAIPGFYTIVTPINTAIFAWTRNLGFYRFTQLLTILILPWLLMLCLGGFRESSVVIIWAALCPLGSLLLEDLRQTLFWIVGFVVLLIVSALLQPYLVPVGLPEAFVTWFFVLNVGAVIAITFGLLYYFVGRRNFFQQRSEMLLLNILPKEISEALKADQRTIAAQYDAASILFADVVEFTPMAAKMTPLRTGRSTQRGVSVLRRPGREIRSGEDQDDRRLLHGRIRRAAIAARPRDRDRRPGARLAGCRRRAPVRRPPALASASASTPVRWWPASSAARNSFMTCGAKP